MVSPRPTAFVVIDLQSQASAFSRFVRGWPEERILRWLAWYGEIKGAHGPGLVPSPFYYFVSASGLDATFHLVGDRFTFVGDNTAWVPR